MRNSIDSKRIGRQIKYLREAHNMSQQELANKVLISRKSVVKWESGMGAPSIELLKPLSEILGISIDELLFPSSEFDE